MTNKNLNDSEIKSIVKDLIEINLSDKTVFITDCSKNFSSLVKLAKFEWDQYNIEKPTQFNIQRLKDDEGRIFWACEFELESCWQFCTTWESGEAATAIYDSCEFDFLDASWEEEWDEEIN